MKITGPWDAAAIETFLVGAAIPLRLSVLDAEGAPLVLSLWFVPLDGALWCATGPDALVVQHLGRDPRCAFEVAGDTPPYRGVRGQGRASLHPERGAEILTRLLARYRIAPNSRLARMLTARAADEVAIRLQPARLATWDFSRRMAGATGG
jgi:hypothetical protein